MLHAQALVDYGTFRSAKVVVFVDTGEPRKAVDLVRAHGEGIQRVAALFGARVLMVDRQRIPPELIVDNDIADAWVLLVDEGRSRAMTTRKNPHKVNVNTDNDWEDYAFRELLRQIKESTAIIEDVTGYYQRFTLSGGDEASRSMPSGPN